MKLTLLALALLVSFGAQASYYENNCSNGDGTLRWETGHNNNEIVFRVTDDSGNEATHKFDHDKVNIKLSKEKKVASRTVEFECGASYHDWTSASAVITPTAEIKAEFKRILKKVKVQDYVICHAQEDGEDETCEPEKK